MLDGTRLLLSQITRWSTPRTQWSREEVGFPLITIIVASKTTCGDVLFETLDDELAWRSLSPGESYFIRMVKELPKSMFMWFLTNSLGILPSFQE